MVKLSFCVASLGGHKHYTLELLLDFEQIAESCRFLELEVMALVVSGSANQYLPLDAVLPARPRIVV